jgi:hypothetical protein
MKAIHLVLDTSAILAYAEGSSDVGEPLTQVAENDAAFTVPLTVLATAAAATEQCHVLTAEPGLYAALGDDPPIIST